MVAVIRKWHRLFLYTWTLDFSRLSLRLRDLETFLFFQQKTRESYQSTKSTNYFIYILIINYKSIGKCYVLKLFD